MKLAILIAAVFVTACASVPVVKPDRPPDKYGGYYLVAYSYSPTSAAKEFVVLLVGVGAKYVTVYYAPESDSWYAVSKYTSFIEAKADYLDRVRKGVPTP